MVRHPSSAYGGRGEKFDADRVACAAVRGDRFAPSRGGAIAAKVTSALNVSQQSADSLRPYALRTRATAGAARTASAARAPHAASQHVAASQACARGGAKVWLQHFFSAEQHVGLARAVARGPATAGLPRSAMTRNSIVVVVKAPISSMLSCTMPSTMVP